MYSGLGVLGLQPLEVDGGVGLGFGIESLPMEQRRGKGLEWCILGCWKNENRVVCLPRAV